MIQLANSNQKRTRVAALISDKTDLKQKLLPRQWTFYNDKRFTLSRKGNNYKYICTQQKSPKIMRQKKAELKGRNRQFNNV